MAYGLLLLRVVIGATMFAHGSQKIFGWWGGGGPRATADFFGSVGWRAPLVQAVMAGLSECAGLLFALGFLTPFDSLAICVVMVTAVATVHWPNGFFNGKGGFEFNLTLVAAAFALSGVGPGEWSLDNVFGIDWTGAGWALIALGAGSSAASAR
jgi:putative oxidoreductase